MQDVSGAAQTAHGGVNEDTLYYHVCVSGHQVAF